MRLKLCPFCARTPEYNVFNKGTKAERWTVYCKCGAESPRDSKSKYGAARIWNRRRLESLNKKEWYRQNFSS